MKRISIALFFMLLAQSGKAQNLTLAENRSSEQIYAVVDVAAAPEGEYRNSITILPKRLKHQTFLITR